MIHTTNHFAHNRTSGFLANMSTFYESHFLKRGPKNMTPPHQPQENWRSAGCRIHPDCKTADNRLLPPKELAIKASNLRF